MIGPHPLPFCAKVRHNKGDYTRTMSHFLAPLHPDGWKFVGIFALATALLFILVPPLGWVGLVLTVWCAYFFRDPWRVTPQRAGLMVSPADGRVLSVAPALSPAEL